MGRYLCPCCGKEVIETDAYDDNGEEIFLCKYCNETFDELDLEYVSDEEESKGHFNDADDTDDVPSGCAACGGPYPYCKTSCELFDD